MLLTIALLFFAVTSRAETFESVSESKAWLNLLYYEGKSGSYQSLVRKPIFFLSPGGEKNPLAELRANLQAFNRDLPADDNHPQCLFPARYLFLKKFFPVLPAIECPKLQAWTKYYDPEDARFVYASQYISNPSSVFGHSFLLLPSRRQSRSFWLTYNYAADMPADVGPLSYVVGGFGGWFNSEFSVLPYYQRLFQYGSIENRTLWQYRIRMTPEERELLIAHLWEVVHAASFDYYFLDENCAGVLLRIFAAVFADMREANRLAVYVHPMDVIKALQKAGRLGEAEIIPSQNNLLEANMEALTSQQRARVKKVLQKPDGPVDNFDSQSAEALIQYTSFKTHQNEGKVPENLKSLDRNAHLQRAKFTNPSLVYPTKDSVDMAPHLSHGSFGLMAGASSLNGLGVFDIGYRFAIHDIFDFDAGFLKNSTVEGLSVKLSARQDSVWIEDFNFIRIDNYQPYRWFDPKASWRIKLGASENILTPSLVDQMGRIAGAGGITFDLGPAFFFALLVSDLNIGEVPQANFELGPELGAILNWRRIKFFASVAAGKGPFEFADSDFVKIKSGISWAASQNFAVRAGLDWERLPLRDLEGQRSKLELRYFY